jgi:hypothetical protein
MNTLSGRQRILCAIRHEEGDRVPISPRVHTWLISEYGDAGLESLLDPMPDILDSCPDEYHTPAGTISDEVSDRKQG